MGMPREIVDGWQPYPSYVTLSLYTTTTHHACGRHQTQAVGRRVTAIGMSICWAL